MYELEGIELTFCKETKNYYVYEAGGGVVGKLYFPKGSTGIIESTLSFKLHNTPADTNLRGFNQCMN